MLPPSAHGESLSFIPTLTCSCTRSCGCPPTTAMLYVWDRTHPSPLLSPLTGVTALRPELTTPCIKQRRKLRALSTEVNTPRPFIQLVFTKGLLPVGPEPGAGATKTNTADAVPPLSNEAQKWTAGRLVWGSSESTAQWDLNRQEGSRKASGGRGVHPET